MLTVGISTSSGQFALVIGENNTVLFDSSESSGQMRELDDFLSTGLNHCKREVHEIRQLIVDIGPGGTSRVRTGIAFANALAFSLRISVYPVSSMELAGIEAWNIYGSPVINSVKSIKGNAYIGLYNQGITTIKYGFIHEIVPSMVHDLDKFIVIGAHRETIMNLPVLKNKTIIDSLMNFGNAKIFIEKSDFFTGKKCDFPVYAQPITEKTL